MFNKYWMALSLIPVFSVSSVIKVARKNVSDIADTLESKSIMTKFPKIKYDALELADNPSQQQLLIRNAWLKPDN